MESRVFTICKHRCSSACLGIDELDGEFYQMELHQKHRLVVLMAAQQSLHSGTISGGAFFQGASAGPLSRAPVSRAPD